MDAWTVGNGYAVSNTIGASGSVGSLNLAVWMYPGDQLLSLDWSLGTYPFGSDLGFGTTSVSQQFLFSNLYGYDINQIAAARLGGSIVSGDWVTLQNAVTTQGNPVYWDENAGPSQAQESALGTIPSESFNAGGGGNACMPEQQGSFKVIHDFSGQSDGYFPVGVIMDKAGNLYGTTQPYYANGSVYKLAHQAAGWLLDPLYQFSGGGNGATPEGLVLGANGILYGGVNGGAQGCNGGYCGSIFSLRPFPSACRSSLCAWAESVLYNFTGPTDAWDGGDLVTDQAGNLYGISGSGGASGAGAVFELTPALGGWSESILYSFAGGANGQGPSTLLAGNDGNLYGATASGGANNSGMVFRLTPSGDGWTETDLYDIQGAAYWSAPHSLLQDSSGNLYGEYEVVDSVDDTLGVLFMLTPGNPQWTFTELMQGNGQLGSDDFYNLAMDSAGNLYGTAGGAAGCINPVSHGYIFKLTRTSSGWQISTPTFWNNTQFGAGGPLALDPQGNLFGTTLDCGRNQQGTVWELTASP